jgi:hypothetical protein
MVGRAHFLKKNQNISNVVNIPTIVVSEIKIERQMFGMGSRSLRAKASCLSLQYCRHTITSKHTKIASITVTTPCPNNAASSSNIRNSDPLPPNAGRQLLPEVAAQRSEA